MSPILVALSLTTKPQEALTTDDMNNGKTAFPEFHGVYIDPTSTDRVNKRDG